MRLLFFVSVLTLCLFANAQITISTADMPVVGDTFHAHRDTLPAGFSIGQKGANRTWDFSNLSPDEAVTTYAVAPSSTPYAGSFSGSNLALTNDFNAYLYYTNSASSLKVDGFASIDPSLGTISVTFSPKPDQYRFPTTYPGNFSGSSGFVAAKPYSQLPPAIQQKIDDAIAGFPGASVSQVRVTFTSNYKDTIDAWGKVTVPLGTYDALRRKRIETSNTKIEAQITFLGIPSWQTVSNTNSNTTEHSWLSKVTKLPLISLGYDSLRNIISVTYSDIPPPPIAGFTWANPSGGLVNFTNTSSNSPTSYDWDFGDSSAHSTLQNPSGHVYSANGVYYACLTVTNSSGSDTYCDSVSVTGITPFNNPPIANRDSAQIIYPAIANINLLANDIDPDNNDITFNFFFPPLNGTVTHLGNGVIEYAANAGFRGIDSFQYKISDDGSPIKSDTGTVVIEVVGLPFADFTYSSNNFIVQFINTSAGFDSVSWDLGDGATATTNTVVHTYVRGTYTVCLIATNSFGADTTCKVVDLTSVGVAGISSDEINIYPNPASEKLMIETAGLNNLDVSLYNSLGEVVLIRRIENEKTPLDLTGLPSGIYAIQLKSAEGKTSLLKKVVVVR